jgi:Fur family ferric uptake transcriptional regulator
MRIIRKITPFQEYNLTTKRRLLLEVLHEAQGPIDAKELYRRSNDRNQSISLATVYRSLNLFKQLGLIDERKLTKAYCSYEIKKSLEHMHLVCKCCGKVIEFENRLVRKLVGIIMREQSFKVKEVDLAIKGYCAKCLSKMTWEFDEERSDGEVCREYVRQSK